MFPAATAPSRRSDLRELMGLGLENLDYTGASLHRSQGFSAGCFLQQPHRLRFRPARIKGSRTRDYKLGALDQK